MSSLHRQFVDLHAHDDKAPGAPLEAKVVVPAISMLTLVAVVGALYSVADEFGLDLTASQEQTLVKLGLALLPVLQFVVGYYTRHTPRPDVPHPPAPAVDHPEQ